MSEQQTTTVTTTTPPSVKTLHGRCPICYPVGGVAYQAMCGALVSARRIKGTYNADTHPTPHRICVVCADMTTANCRNRDSHP